MNAITGVPAAYRPRDLGPRQIAHLKRIGWIDDRRVVKRTKSHKPWCNEQGSAYVCSCQTQEKPE